MILIGMLKPLAAASIHHDNGILKGYLASATINFSVHDSTDSQQCWSSKESPVSLQPRLVDQSVCAELYSAHPFRGCAAACCCATWQKIPHLLKKLAARREDISRARGRCPLERPSWVCGQEKRSAKKRLMRTNIASKRKHRCRLF